MEERNKEAQREELTVMQSILSEENFVFSEKDNIQGEIRVRVDLPEKQVEVFIGKNLGCLFIFLFYSF